MTYCIKWIIFFSQYISCPYKILALLNYRSSQGNLFLSFISSFLSFSLQRWLVFEPLGSVHCIIYYYDPTLSSLISSPNAWPNMFLHILLPKIILQHCSFAEHSIRYKANSGRPCIAVLKIILKRCRCEDLLRVARPHVTGDPLTELQKHFKKKLVILLQFQSSQWQLQICNCLAAVTCLYSAGSPLDFLSSTTFTEGPSSKTWHKKNGTPLLLADQQLHRVFALNFFSFFVFYLGGNHKWLRVLWSLAIAH